MTRAALNSREAAAYLNISEKHLFNQVQAGGLAALKIGNVLRYRIETLDQYLIDQEQKWKAAHAAKSDTATV